MHLFKRNFIFLGFIFAAVVLSANGFLPVYAQEADPNAVASRRQQLEEELAKIESQIEAYRSTIEEKQREATTFERDIAILDAEINKNKLEIKARDLSISKLADDIQQRTQLINSLLIKLDDEKSSLAELLRRQNELDSTPLVEIVLGYEKFSDFFADINNLGSIQEAIQVSFKEIEQSKNTAGQEKEQLQNQKLEETELRYLQNLEKKRKEEIEANKKNLLKLTKGKEKEYQKLLTSRQKNAATIRSQLFMLQGSPAIPFEKALEYANVAYRITGIRQAFLLGVITQETKLGEDIGQCLLTNKPNKGDGKGKNTGTVFRGVMKPTRDVDPFMSITAALGLDPMQMPVSCPQTGGYGGAMGPAQFISSTWVLYEDKIASFTGHNPPNPWDPLDAFVASALLLKDNGGAGGVYASERKAALKYFAGSNWNKSNYAIYGDYVMDFAAQYQEMINILQGS